MNNLPRVVARIMSRPESNPRPLDHKSEPYHYTTEPSRRKKLQPTSFLVYFERENSFYFTNQSISYNLFICQLVKYRRDVKEGKAFANKRPNDKKNTKRTNIQRELAIMY